MEIDHLAQALDACLERYRAGGRDALAAVAACPEAAGDPQTAATLAALMDVVAALDDSRPPLPAPDRDFRCRLAAELAVAPAPSTLPAAYPAAALSVASNGASNHTAPRPTSDLVQALDLGLGALAAQGADLETVLAAHPDIAGELAPLLDLAAELRAVPAAPSPDVGFRRRLAADLATAPPPRALRRAAAPRNAGLLRRLWRSTAFMAASAATVLIFLLSGMTFASASALPGDWLYPVKRGAERLQVWLAPDDAVELHLGLAGLRLREALLVSGASGSMLADFSYEVTAALVAADRRLDRGAGRDAVSRSLLPWLLQARGDLVTARPGLPPTAWRAALALVDEAIAALQSGAPLAVAPVPRLGDPRDRLLVQGPALITRVKPAARLVTAGRAEPSSGASGGRRPRDAAPRARSGGAGVVAVAPTPIPPSTEAPPPPAPAQVRPDEPEPDDDPPTPTPVTIVLTPTPPPPPEVSPTPSPADPPPSATPAQPTVPVNVPPVITAVSCNPPKLETYGEATCRVEVTDADDHALTYTWYVSPANGTISGHTAPEMKLTVWNHNSGIDVEVQIKITVTDGAGHEARGEAKVMVFAGVAQEP